MPNTRTKVLEGFLDSVGGTSVPTLGVPVKPGDRLV
jgi:hypothetical protein